MISRFKVLLKFSDIGIMLKFIESGESYWLISDFSSYPESAWSIKFDGFSKLTESECIANARFLVEHAPNVLKGDTFSACCGANEIAYGEVIAI